MIERYEIINHFTSKFNKCRYLEIGSQFRKCFDLIDADIKHDIEPDIKCNPCFKMTSDDFFRNNKLIYDVIFIDGLHHWEQVLKDVYNGSKSLSDDGYIIIHDCLPNLEIEQLREQRSLNWLGDVWKVQAWLVENFKRVFTISDSDRGCGIIEGKIDFKIPQNLSFEWDDFKKNKENILRLVTWSEYLKRRKIVFKELKLTVYEF